MTERSPVPARRVRAPWRVAMVPAWAAAGVGAGFAVVSVAASWQLAGGHQHPAAQGWGVAGVSVLAVVTVLAVAGAAARGDRAGDDRWRIVWNIAAAAVLAALAGTVAVAVRSWTSDQLLPGFGGAAGLASVVAAAAAGVLTLWALVAGQVLRRVIFAAGVAVAVAAAGIAAAVGTAGWGSLSVAATTTAAVAAPAGEVAAAPTHALWATTPVVNVAPGDQAAVAGGLVVVPAAAGDRYGVEALDAVTGQVRWRYLRGNDGGAEPVIVMSARAVGLSWAGLPAVFLDARTGQPEPLTHASLSVLSPDADQAMMGTTYVRAQTLRRSGEIVAVSAVTGQRLWADRMPDCPFFRHDLVGDGAEPGIVQDGHVIAALYGCQRSSAVDAAVTVHLALFGPGGSRRDVTIGQTDQGGNTVGDAGLVTAGNTLLVKTDAVGDHYCDQTAVSAATGAVLWRKQAASVDAVTGDGQVILDTTPPSAPRSTTTCGRYAAASARLLAAYSASTCSALFSVVPQPAAHGRVYVPSLSRTYALGLQLTAVDVSDGAILATTVIQPPAGVDHATGDGFVNDLAVGGVARADGSILLIEGADGVLAVR